MRDARGYEPGKNWDEPMYNVFHKGADGVIRHTWGSEMLYVKEDPARTTGPAIWSIRCGACWT